MHLSKLYSLPVERVDGRRRGYVLSAICSGGAIAALFCADENEREFYVVPQDIVRASDCILYRAESRQKVRGTALRLNLPAYDCRGRFLGHAEDYTVKKFVLGSCLISGRSYSVRRLSIGDAVIVGCRDGAAVAIAAKDMFLQAVVGGTQ